MQLSFEFDHDNHIKKMKMLDYIPEDFGSLRNLDEYNLRMIMGYYEKAIEATENINSLYKSNCIKREPFKQYLEVLLTEYEILKTKQ